MKGYKPPSPTGFARFDQHRANQGQSKSSFENYKANEALKKHSEANFFTRLRAFLAGLFGSRKQ